MALMAFGTEIVTAVNNPEFAGNSLQSF